MWLNVNIAILNTTFQFLVIYRIDIDIDINIGEG